MKKTILITGANRGIGLEFVRQLCETKDTDIIACCRDPKNAAELSRLAEHNNHISIFKLDVTDDAQIKNLAEKLQDKPLDWIINNAGVSGDQGVSAGNIDRNNFLKVLNVNCLSPLKICDSFLTNLKKGRDKLIVCISSQMGSISDNKTGRSYAYRTSKAALNCAMRSFAIDCEVEGIKVILLHPGWVQTDMGGNEALIDVQTSVSGMLRTIQAKKDSSHGDKLYTFDGKVIDW